MLFLCSCEEEEGLYGSSTGLRSAMGHHLFPQRFSRAVPVRLHSLWGNVCSFEPLLLSASLPFQSFGFPPTSLVLLSIHILHFLPSSHSCSWSGGLRPESQFWAVSAPQQTSQHCDRRHCTAHSSAAKEHTDFASQDCSNKWIYRQRYLWRQFFPSMYISYVSENGHRSSPGGASGPVYLILKLFLSN